MPIVPLDKFGDWVVEKLRKIEERLVWTITVESNHEAKTNDRLTKLEAAVRDTQNLIGSGKTEALLTRLDKLESDVGDNGTNWLALNKRIAGLYHELVIRTPNIPVTKVAVQDLPTRNTLNVEKPAQTMTMNEVFLNDTPTPQRITQSQVVDWLDACTIGNSHGATPGSQLVYADRLTNVINAFIFGEERS